MGGYFDDLRRALRRAALRFDGWPRRLVALACLVLAGLSVLGSTRAGRSGTSVVVAARDVPAGRALTAADLRVRRWPAGLAVTRTYARTADVVGRMPAGPLARGQPITETGLVGAGLAVGLPPGTVVTTVTLAAGGASALLHPGERIDLLRGPPIDSGGAAPTGPGTVVASGVLVLAVTVGSDAAAVTVAVAVTDETALRLAGMAGQALLATLRTR